MNQVETDKTSYRGRVYITAGHVPDASGGNYDPGAVANGLKEADVVNEFVELVCAHFRDWGVPHSTDNDADSLKILLDKLELQPDDILCDVHCNAGPEKATGVEVIVPERSTDKERQLAKAILDAITGITGLNSRGVKSETQTARKRLAVMRESGTNVLIELFFITNLGDIAKYDAKKTHLALNVANILRLYVKG